MLTTPGMPASVPSRHVPYPLAEGKAMAAEETFAIYPKEYDAGENSPYNFATITGTRGGVEFTEIWLLINAYWDAKSRRFKRVNIDNFSFGYQWQGGGTYPGEEAFGDLINQGMNLWRAVGRKAFAANDPMREEVGEDIGLYVDGEWREYGYFLGWNNCFMCDSYGGMTIGGAGFEIDGNGVFPFKRVSLGKFVGGSEDPGRPIADFGFAYNATLWNTYHGLFDSDRRNKNSFMLGMQSPIDWYPNDPEVLDQGSNIATLDDVQFVWKMLPKDAPSKAEYWQDILSLGQDGYGTIRGATMTTTVTVEAQTIGPNVSAFYPQGYTRDNTYVVAVLAADGLNTKQIGFTTVTMGQTTITAFLGETYTGVRLVLAKHKK